MLNGLVGAVTRSTAGSGGLCETRCTFGGRTPYDALQASAAYTLEDVHEKVPCDVLVLRGDDDIYGPRQGSMFRNAFLQPCLGQSGRPSWRVIAAQRS